MHRLAITLFLCAGIAAAQNQTRTVTLTWTDNLNPPTTVYNVYRYQGACAPNPPWNLVEAGVAVKTYDHLNVLPGRQCYAVTAVFDTVESDKSDPAMAQVKPARPTGLNIMAVAVGAIASPFRALARVASGKPRGIRLRTRVT